jgi:hypothetical protein
MKEMKDNRGYQAGLGMHDTDYEIERAGGHDLRPIPENIIERKVFNYDVSAYNHNSTPTQPANRGHENEIIWHENDIHLSKY